MKSNLLDDCEDVALADDGAFLAVNLDLGTGVLAGQDLVADLDDHLNVLTIHIAAGADCDDLGNLGLLLGGAGQDQAALGGFFFLDQLNDNAVCKRVDFHSGSSSL